MSIHQLSVHYRLDEDRLLLKVRTVDGALYEAWLTRRLVARLWVPLSKTVAQASLGGAARNASLLPEARDMLVEAARERSREKADFSTPFNEEAISRPLGEQPMLVSEVDLAVGKDHQMKLNLRDARGRNLELSMNDEIASNLIELVKQALRQSDWGLDLREALVAAAPPAAARVLN